MYCDLCQRSQLPGRLTTVLHHGKERNWCPTCLRSKAKGTYQRIDSLAQRITDIAKLEAWNETAKDWNRE